MHKTSLVCMPFFSTFPRGFVRNLFNDDDHALSTLQTLALVQGLDKNLQSCSISAVSPFCSELSARPLLAALHVFCLDAAAELSSQQDQGWGDAGPYTTCVKCTVPNCDSCSAPGDKCNFCSAGFVVNTVTSKCVAEADMIPCEERKCDQCNSLYFFSSGDDCTSCGKDRVCQRWRSSTKLRLTGLRLARCEVFCELEWAVLGGQISALQNK